MGPGAQQRLQGSPLAEAAGEAGAVCPEESRLHLPPKLPILQGEVLPQQFEHLPELPAPAASNHSDDTTKSGNWPWCRQMRAEPRSMAAFADATEEYDPVNPSYHLAPLEQAPAGALRGKRKFGQPDTDFGSVRAAAVEDDAPTAGGSRRWKKKRPKCTFEQMLDAPCCFHTPDLGHPAKHSTRQCSWLGRVRRGEGFDQPRFQQPPPPPPLTGANTQAMPARLAYRENQDGKVDVHQGDNSNKVGKGRNDCDEHRQSYVILVTEPTDKQGQRRRALEVNAVRTVVPQYLYWSETGKEQLG